MGRIYRSKKTGLMTVPSREYHNQFGYFGIKYNSVVDSQNFCNAFIDTCKALGDDHVVAVNRLYIWLHGFEKEK